MLRSQIICDELSAIVSRIFTLNNFYHKAVSLHLI